MMSRLWAQMAPLLVIVWVLAITLAHYLVQFPLTPGRLAGLANLSWAIDPVVVGSVLRALGTNALSVVAVQLLVLVGAGLGFRLLKRVTGGLSTAEQVSLSLLLGLGLLSFPILALGLLGWIPPRWAAWLITLLASSLLYRDIRNWLATLLLTTRSLFAPSVRPAERWLRRGILLLLGLALILAFAPPTMWDSLTYHLAGPQHYLDAGRIVSFQENHFFNFPQVVSMLYLWLMRLAGPTAPAVLHWIFGVSLIMMLVGFAMRIGHPRAGWLTALIMLSADSLWMEYFWPYNDLALMAFTMAAIILILDWAASDFLVRWRPLLWTGVFVGLAMGTKYTAAGASIAVGIMILWVARRTGMGFALLSAAAVAIIAGIIFSPWLLKNAVLDANPIAPFGAGTLAFDELDQWYYTRPGTGLNLVGLIFVPIQAAIFSQEGASFQAASGVLPVALLAVVPLGWRSRDPALRVLLLSLILFVLVGYLIWIIGASVSWFLLQVRLLYPIYPALALILALSVVTVHAPRDGLSAAPLVNAAVAVVAIMSVLNSLMRFIESDALQVIAGLQSEDDYLLQTLGAHYAAMQMVNELPEDAQILFLWEPRHFYCNRLCMPDSMIDRWWHDRQLQSDPFTIAESWARSGATHVLVFETGGRFLLEQEPFDPMTDADFAALDELRDMVLIPVWDDIDAYTLYALRVDQP